MKSFSSEIFSFFFFYLSPFLEQRLRNSLLTIDGKYIFFIGIWWVNERKQPLLCNFLFVRAHSLLSEHTFDDYYKIRYIRNLNYYRCIDYFKIQLSHLGQYEWYRKYRRGILSHFRKFLLRVCFYEKRTFLDENHGGLAP